MDGRNEQTEIEDHTLVDIEEQATQHVVTAMKGKLQCVSGRQKTMDGRNEQTETSEVNIPISSSHRIPREMAAASWRPETPPKVATADKTPMVGGSSDWPPVVTIKEKLGILSDASEDRCIYRVPKHLRDTNEAAYVPRLVSLGPFHHDNVNLKAMEEHKLRCFNSFIKKHDLDALQRLVKKHEETTRGFYAERISLPSKEFVEVILVDAIFIINFLLESNSSGLAIESNSSGSIYHKKFFGSMVSRDMMLLENQLPLDILQKILDFVTSTPGTGKTEKLSVTKLSNFLFKCHMKEEGSGTKPSNCLFNCHMKEEGSVTKPSNCLFNCHMKEEGTHHKSDMTDLNSHNNARHFVDLQRLLYKPVEVEARGEPKNNGKFKKIKSISKLHEAGVRFRVASGNKLFHIEFKDGVLEIPGIVVDDSTEAIFRNLSAYDQCRYGPSPIGDYFVLMGMLIDTADDVDLLVKNKILQNDLPTAQEVSKVFNCLEKEVFYEAESFYYLHLCEQLNEFCDIPWHKWMATLKQNYLDTPWKVISLIAAFILLVLTMIQTVFSVISP